LIHFHAKPLKPSKTFMLAQNAVKAAEKKGAVAIVALHCDVEFLRGISSYRPDMPVFAGCHKEEDVRELRLAFGIWPVPVTERSAKNAIAYAKYSLKPNDKVMVIEPLKKGYKTAVMAFKQVK
jgi:pyruvate kinase